MVYAVIDIMFSFEIIQYPLILFRLLRSCLEMHPLKQDI